MNTFSYGTSSNTYSSDSAQKRLRRVYLDPYSATRVENQEYALRTSTKAMEAKNGPRSIGDDASWLKMGQVDINRSHRVGGKCFGSTDLGLTFPHFSFGERYNYIS